MSAVGTARGPRRPRWSDTVHAIAWRPAAYPGGSMRTWLIALLVLGACMQAPAQAAACPRGESLVFQCGFESGKRVQVCAAGTSAIYRFGRPAQPVELTLRSDTARAFYEQSSGMKEDHLRMSFANGATVYRIQYGAWFYPGSPSGAEARLRVTSKGRRLTELTCTESSIEVDTEKWQQILPRREWAD